MGALGPGALSSPAMKTIIEPFRIKAIEPISMTTREQRQARLEEAGFNLFKLKAQGRPHRPADRLRHLGDERGAVERDDGRRTSPTRGSDSYRRFEEAVTELMPFRHVIPTHQGRAAEAILFSLLGGAGKRIPSNTHFDTTRGNLEATGAEGLDLLIPEGTDPTSLHPFKGDMDLAALEALLEEHGEEVPVRDDHGHQQRRRRPAGQPGEHPRGGRAGAPARQAVSSSTAAASPRTPGSSSSASRARRSARSRRSCATCSPRPTA